MESDFHQSAESLQTIRTPDAEFVEGTSPSMRGLVSVMQEVAQSEVPVLLLAEKGAGQKATARRIHELSRRAGQPFTIVSCSSEKSVNFNDLSGPSCFAHAGTVFLEELSELRVEGQARLFQALVGRNLNGEGTQAARFICGSSCDLEVQVKAGNLREDLYYRISGVCLRIPPLRQRREDIPILLEHFLRKFAHDFQRSAPAVSDETRRLFQEYSWPGNVRELENAAKAIVALGNETVAMDGLRAVLCRPKAGVNGGGVSLKQAARAASREMEKELILRALTRTHWNRRRAAQDLQISYKALLYKLKQIGCSEYRAS